MGEKIKWHPDYMSKRFENWTENLAIDWCISRQRFFGVPIPVWYRTDDKGEVNYNDVILPNIWDMCITVGQARWLYNQLGQEIDYCRLEPNAWTQTTARNTWLRLNWTRQIG